MKRIIYLFIFLFSSMTMLVACGSSYNEEGFEKVEAYADEIIPAIDKALFDLESLAAEIALEAGDTTFDLDSFEEHEMIEYLNRISSHVNILRNINDYHWASPANQEQAGDFLGNPYDEEEISSWNITRRGADEEWEIQGEELAEALFNMEASSRLLADEIERVIERGHQLSMEDLDRVIGSYERANESMENLMLILYNQS